MLGTINHPILRNIEPIDSKLLVGDKIQPGHALFGLVWINPRRS